MSKRRAGVVKWFEAKKGYGFITDSEGKDVFVHYSDIEEEGFRNLMEGDEVTFDIEVTEKGDKAVEVRK